LGSSFALLVGVKGVYAGEAAQLRQKSRGGFAAARVESHQLSLGVSLVMGIRRVVNLKAASEAPNQIEPSQPQTSAAMKLGETELETPAA
jgi:hypothetical protein